MKNIYTILIILFASSMYAQKIDVDSLKNVIKTELKEELDSTYSLNNSNKERLLQWSKFSLKGYGAVNYYAYNYDTDKQLRNKIDPERLNLYLNYHFTDNIQLNTEIEFEHGGTGVTLELDTQEEFGEYEQEIEKGGGVKLEQLNVQFNIKPYINVKVGRFKLLFNESQVLDDPDEYFTTHRPEMENTLLPLGWYEMGVEAFGKFWNNKMSYRLAFVNGLDATGFSSANWIKLGYQEKFEMANAENFAIMTNLNYSLGKSKHSMVGVSYYYGNSADNRPKPDLNVDAHVKIVGAHLSYFEHPFRFASQFIWGEVQNSAQISARNANQPSVLGIKKTPVAKNALGFSAEFGYDILPLFHHKGNMNLYPFLRYDYYDSMYKTVETVTDNPRWERSAFTTGINWYIIPNVILKAQYSTRKLGSDNINIVTGDIDGKEMENTFSTGIGFAF